MNIPTRHLPEDSLLDALKMLSLTVIFHWFMGYLITR